MTNQTPFAAVLIQTLPLLVLIYLMPESPRYLIKHGNYWKALEAFEQIQTTSLLASRDLMYAHAQLDFESRLLKNGVDEYRGLAQRIDISVQSLSEVSPYHPQNVLQVNRIISQTSISPGQSIELAQNNSAPNDEIKMSPRDSHQSSHEHGNGTRGQHIHLADFERHESDPSSIDIDWEIRREEKKNNPYSYNIGVIGYSKRLFQLSENKRCRRALLSASIAMISQQMTGVNTSTWVHITNHSNRFANNRTIRSCLYSPLFLASAQSAVYPRTL